jgi:predicted nucleic acid-binding protein
MICFVDTSAILAVLDAGDFQNKRAGEIWTKLVTTHVQLVCTNYILIEATALMQNRLGLSSVKLFQTDILPLLKVEWLTEIDHESGIGSLFVSNRRALSLVDCISFNMMRKMGIVCVFAFDRHFKEQGFTLMQ